MQPGTPTIPLMHFFTQPPHEPQQFCHNPLAPSSTSPDPHSIPFPNSARVRVGQSPLPDPLRWSSGDAPLPPLAITPLRRWRSSTWVSSSLASAPPPPLYDSPRCLPLPWRLVLHPTPPPDLATLPSTANSKARNKISYGSLHLVKKGNTATVSGIVLHIFMQNGTRQQAFNPPFNLLSFLHAFTRWC